MRTPQTAEQPLTKKDWDLNKKYIPTIKVFKEEANKTVSGKHCNSNPMLARQATYKPRYITKVLPQE